MGAEWVIGVDGGVEWCWTMRKGNHKKKEKEKPSDRISIFLLLQVKKKQSPIRMVIKRNIKCAPLYTYGFL